MGVVDDRRQQAGRWSAMSPAAVAIRLVRMDHRVDFRFVLKKYKAAPHVRTKAACSLQNGAVCIHPYDIFRLHALVSDRRRRNQERSVFRPHADIPP
jgi:hypothetical protein